MVTAEEIKTWFYLAGAVFGAIGVIAAFGGAVMGFRLNYMSKKQCGILRDKCSAECDTERNKEMSAIAKKIDDICSELKQNREHGMKVIAHMGRVEQYMKDHCARG